MANGSRQSRWLRSAGAVAGLGAFAFALHGADLDSALLLIAAAGPLVLVALIPHLIQIGLDALAWRTLLAGLERRVTWVRLFAVRLSTEAVLMTLPAGSLVGETLKPYLLRRHGVPVAETVASIAVKKCLLVFAQAAYLTTAILIGAHLFPPLSASLPGGRAIHWLAAGAVLVLLLIAVTLALSLARGALGERFHRFLLRFPGKRLRGWLESRRGGFAATDVHLVMLGGAQMRRLAAMGLLYGAWMVEAFETWLLLRLVGLHLPFVAVLAMEAMVVFLRNAAFVMPAGLGVQDAGYLAFLRALGGSVESAGPAFVILKRMKELVWIAAGYLTLALHHGDTDEAPRALHPG